MSAPQPANLYQVLLEGPGDSVASLIRFRMADEALSDTAWRQLYDDVADSRLGHPENLPSMLPSWSELPPSLETDHTLLGAWAGSPLAAASPLRMRALELGAPTSAEVDTFDLVAAVTAAEVWCAATGVRDLARAVSIGMDAVSSLAAILARAAGHPVADTAGSSGVPEQRFASPDVDSAVRRARSWAQAQLGPVGVPAALRAARADLCFGATGRSLTHQAALRVPLLETARG